MKCDFKNVLVLAVSKRSGKNKSTGKEFVFYEAQCLIGDVVAKLNFVDSLPRDSYLSLSKQLCDLTVSFYPRGYDFSARIEALEIVK